jgi:TolB protein
LPAGFGALAAQQPSAAPSSSAAAVSPDGRHVAFTSDRGGADQVYVIDVDGGAAHAVPGSGAGRARWSREGRELLVSGAGADSGRIFSIPANGGDRRVVASVPGRSPVLSPDGRRVAFLVGPWTSTALAVANPDGSDVRMIAGGGTTAWNPAWSPDGHSIAYTYGDTTSLLQVHVVDVDGTGDRAVTHLTAADGSAQVPAWSPDGRRLAIQAGDSRPHSSHLWIVDLVGGQAVRLAAHEAAYLDEVPTWFPDGRRLAFQSDRSGSMQIWLMNVDGTEQVQLTR